MIHADRLKTIRQRDATERARIEAFGAELRGDIRADRQKAMLDALKADTQKNIDAIEADTVKELDQVRAQVQRVRFPALSASDVATRTLGELQLRNAHDHGEAFDAESLRDAVAFGRIDYASALLDRATGIEAQTPEAIERRVDFFETGKELFAPLLSDLETKRAALQTVLREIDTARVLANAKEMYPGRMPVV